MNKPKVVLITGGRKFKDRAHVNKVLNECLPWFAHDFVLVQGGANGVDWYAKDWALNNGFPCITMNAAWDFFGKTAGGIRNGWMISYTRPDLLIAFDGGSGTADMKKQCSQRGITVYEA